MNDIRHAVRQLVRNPGFSGVAVLILALGIGANTAIFSAAELTLLRPLPFRDDDRLVRIYQVPQGGTPRISPRSPTFLAVKERGRFFESIVAQRFTDFTLTTDEGPERIIGSAVSEGWAATLGVQPLVGRVFTPNEEDAGEEAGVVLLSYGVWQRLFGGQRDALERTIRLNGRAHAVVGVMPPGFNYPYGAQLWVPMRVEPQHRGFWAFNAQARLAPGVTLQQARSELRDITRRLTAEVADFTPGMTLTAVPTRETLVGQEGRTVMGLLAAVAFFLIIVCVNLANLALARALGRGREFAVRASLGAGRWRLLRQALAESLFLSAIGGVAGIGVAYLATGLAEPLLPRRFADFGSPLTLNTTVLLFAVAISMAVGVAFGCAPALRLARSPAVTALQAGVRSIGSRGSRRLANGLIVAELALALALLSGAGLMLRDFQRLHSEDLGYNPEGLAIFNVDLSREPYNSFETRVEFLRQTTTELEAMPGIAAVGATSMFPSHRGNSVAEVEIAAREAIPGERLLVNDRIVTPGFLAALGIPLLRGRGIRNTDRGDSPPVVVISQTMASRFWGDEDPIGKRVRNARLGDEAAWMTVVGVVGNVKEYYDVEETWYVPYAQHADRLSASQAVFAVRSTSETGPGLSALTVALARVDPELPIFNFTAASDLHGEFLARQRQGAWLAGAFAAFGLFLAALGLYGSISYAVGRRTREIGLRMALGSDRARVLWTVGLEGARLVLLGTLVGAALSLAVTHLLARTLTEVDALDPLSFGLATALLVATALGATLAPTLRAARVDPMEALRHE